MAKQFRDDYILVKGIGLAVTSGRPWFDPAHEYVGFTATQSGLALMPRVAVMMIATPIIGRIYNHVSPRLIVGLGVIFFFIGAWDMSHFTLDMTSGTIIRAIAILVTWLLGTT